MENYEITVITWDGIEIEVGFCRSWATAVAKNYGVHLCHFEIRTRLPERAALPITETGYRSIFIYEPDIADFASPVDYVIAMLNEAAQSPEWRKMREKAQQYSLF